MSDCKEESVTSVQEKAAAPSRTLDCYVQIITDVWKSVMNYDEIAQDDNFFLLGGDSILGIIMLARLLEETDAELTMLDLYERPKPSQLGELLERRLAQP